MNSSNNCSSSSQLPHVFPVNAATSAIMGLSFVLGVPGNIAVLGILVRRLKENNFTLRMMLSLAVSDLMNLLPLPIWIWALLHGWTFGSAACKIVSYVEYWCVYCSSLCVTLMSVQRYMHVLHPQKWAKLGARGEKALLGGIWILSGAVASYAPVLREVRFEQHGLQYCSQQFRNVSEEVTVLVVEILQFVICFCFLVYFYYCLHREVNESPFFSSNRMTKLVTRIVLAFFFFYILIPIINISIIVAIALENENLKVYVRRDAILARALVTLSSCVNPFLYTFSLRGQHQCCTSVENT